MRQFDTKSIQTPTVDVIGFESNSYAQKLKDFFFNALKNDGYTHPTPKPECFGVI